MPTAAFSPEAMAETTELGPVAASPPAKSQGIAVEPSLWLAAMNLLPPIGISVAPAKVFYPEPDLLQ